MIFAFRARFALLAIAPLSIATTVWITASGLAQNPAPKKDAAAPANSAPSAAATPPAATPPTTATPPQDTAGSTGLTTTGEVSTKDLLDKGNAALKAGDFQAAVLAFSEAFHNAERNGGQDRQADDAAAIFGRARAFAGLKNYAAALKDYGSLIQNYFTPDDPNVVPILIARGMAELEANRNDDALQDFQKAVDLDFSNLDALFGLGKALATLGKSEDAIIPLTAVITANPKNAEAYRFRGLAYSSLFKNKKALEDLEKAIQLNPDDYEAYFSLGIVNNRHQDYEKAADAFNKAIEHYKPKPGQEDEPFVLGYINCGSAYIELGKASTDPAAQKAAFQAALDISQKLINLLEEKNPAHAKAIAAALLNRGIAERMLGQIGAAIRTLTRGIELRTTALPDEQTNGYLNDAYFRRGICFHLVGEDKMAISDFQSAAHLMTEDPRANFWEGCMYASLGNYREALRAYGDAIAASDRYTPAYYNRALSYMMLADYPKAIADFSEAIRLDPTNAEYYFKRGVAYEQLGEYQKASESFASAIEFDKTHAAAYRHMADVQQRLGHTELVNQYRQKADELAPPKKSS